MRVKQPEPFDREREYKPGERAIVNGTVLIATLWTPAAQRLADSSKTLFCQRCVRCKIGKDICTGANLKCDKYSRTDRKTIFWRLAYPKSNAVRTIKKIVMNKQVLSPFDCDMCAMIEDITKQEIEVTASDTSIRLSWAQNGSDGNDKAEGQRIEALKQAIRGRLGDRLIEFFYDDGMQSVYMKYDPEEYPEEMRTRLTDPDATAGTRYCRTLLEVDAIQFRRDNVDDVLRFTGGGTVTTPRTLDGKAMFSLPDGNGIFVDVPESWYIIRELNGRFTARPEKDFKREFEPKGTPAENYTEQPARPVVAQIANLFNELFGTNIASRCRKMEEEFNEYKAAVKHALPEFDDPGRMNAVIDELADLNAVVFHSAVILGISQRDLLEMAYDKVKGRQTDPNYKRTHPHEPNKGCGDCSNFMYEDVNGNGYCEAFKSEQSCGMYRCQDYKPKN